MAITKIIFDLSVILPKCFPTSPHRPLSMRRGEPKRLSAAALTKVLFFYRLVSPPTEIQ